MKIEIFEIDLSYGDIFIVTKHGNQIIIPQGERLFENWSDDHGFTQLEYEREYDPDDRSAYSTSKTYDKSEELLTEFANGIMDQWEWQRDRGGDLYGDIEELPPGK